MTIPHKILFIDDFGHPGGAEIATLRLIQGLDKELFHPYLILPFEGEVAQRARKLGAKVIFIDLSSRKKDIFKIAPTLKSIFQLKKLIKNEGISLLHPISLWSCYFTFMANFVRVQHVESLPLILSLHAFPKIHSQKKNLFFKITKDRMLRKVDEIIVVSKALKKSLISMGMAYQHITIIPNGTDLEFMKGGDGKKFKAINNIPTDKIVIGMLGRIHPGKGQMVFVRSMKYIVERFPQVHFVIAGEEYKTVLENLDFKQRLMREVEMMGLVSHVSFIGFWENLADLLASFDILAHPSPEETFGMAILDAMAAGLPVIATDTGGIPELVRDGENGFLITPDNPQMLGDKVIELCEDDALRQRMGQAGMVKAESFSIERMAKSTSDIYLKFL